jgi:ABC-type multidrug transport system ATPase subunit
MTHVVEVKNLRRIYQVRGKPDILANDDLSFTVEQGEIFGLLGHNGAGKTTFVMQLMGLLVPTSGQIFVKGINVTKDPQAVNGRVFAPDASAVALPGTTSGIAFYRSSAWTTGG